MCAAPRCSGDMYGSVPMHGGGLGQPRDHRPRQRSRPRSGRCRSRPAARRRRASSTFAGFRSRWTTPRACACASAANSRPNTAAVSAGGSGPARDARAQVASLDQRHREPRRCRPASPWRSTLTIAGCSRRVSTSISRAKRATTSGLVGQRRRQELQRDDLRRRRRRRGRRCPCRRRPGALRRDSRRRRCRCDRSRERSAGVPSMRARARDVDFRGARRTGDHARRLRGQRRVASGAEQVQRASVDSTLQPSKPVYGLPAAPALAARPRAAENAAETRGFARAAPGGTAVAKRPIPCRFPSTSAIPSPASPRRGRRRRRRRRPVAPSSPPAPRPRPPSSSTRAPTGCTSAPPARSTARSRSRSARAASASSARATIGRRSAATGSARRARRRASTSSSPCGYPTPAQARMGFTGGAIGIHGPPRGCDDASPSWRRWWRRTGRPAASPSPPTRRSRRSPPGCASSEVKEVRLAA